jgi:hypothetical protein
MTLLGDVSWVKTHLLLVGVVAALVFGSVYGVESLIANHDAKNAIVLQTLADSQAKANAQFQISVKSQIDAIAAQNAELAAENQTLIKALATRQVIEAKIPVQNSSLSAQDAASALKGQAVNDQVVLPLPVARDLVTSVQLVPLLQADKADLEKSNGLLETEVTNGVKALDLERKAHTNDNDTNAGTIKARDGEISQLKSDCRKSKMKWFFIGYVAGFVSAKFAGI